MGPNLTALCVPGTSACLFLAPDQLSENHTYPCFFFAVTFGSLVMRIPANLRFHYLVLYRFNFDPCYSILTPRTMEGLTPIIHSSIVPCVIMQTDLACKSFGGANLNFYSINLLSNNYSACKLVSISCSTNKNEEATSSNSR